MRSVRTRSSLWLMVVTSRPGCLVGPTVSHCDLLGSKPRMFIRSFSVLIVVSWQPPTLEGRFFYGVLRREGWFGNLMVDIPVMTHWHLVLMELVSHLVVTIKTSSCGM